MFLLQSLNRPPLEIPSPDVSIIPVTFDNSAEETTLPSVAMSASKVTTIVKKDPSYGSCNEYNCTCKGCLAICSSPMSSLPSVICDSPATVSSENVRIMFLSLIIVFMALGIKPIRLIRKN